MTNEDKQIQRVCLSLVRALDKYMDDDTVGKESVKLAVVLSAMTRLLATMTVSMGIPQGVLIEAIKLDMKSALESMMQDETKH